MAVNQPTRPSMIQDIFQPQPRRPKRPLSTLLPEDTSDTSKRPRYEASDNLLGWLRTLLPPVLPRARSLPSINNHSRLFSPPALPPSPLSSAPPRPPRSAPPPRNFAPPNFAPPNFAPPNFTPPNFTPTPPLNGSLYAESNASQSIPSSGSKVENPLYRTYHLAGNGVVLLPPDEALPPVLHPLAQQVRAARTSPQPNVQRYQHDKDLINLEESADESAVEKYMQQEIFLVPPAIKRSDKKRMFQNVVPNNPQTQVTISIPTPDSGYGYDRRKAFPGHEIQLINMGREMVANGEDLVYPFMAIEFTSDGPLRNNSLWVATNQCLGGGSACVKIAETLNARLQQCQSQEVRRVNSAAFSIAMNGTEARLFISWKGEDLTYYTQKLESYLLQRPEDFITFRRHVRNIIDWGRTDRLTGIRNALDGLLEAGRTEASAKAKSRPSPLGSIDAGARVQRRRVSSACPDMGWIWSEEYSQYYYVSTDGQSIWQSQITTS